MQFDGDKVLLSPRQVEICRLVEIGLPNPAIAAVLKISVHTVRDHLSHLYHGLTVANRTGLARWCHVHPAALEGKWVVSPPSQPWHLPRTPRPVAPGSEAA